MSTLFPKILFLLGMALLMVTGVAAASGVEEKLEQLERLIMQQQRQIESQAKTIGELQKQLEVLNSSIPPQTTEASIGSKTGERKLLNIHSKNDKVSVELYGQLNRAVLLTDDGNQDYFYQVDNDHSSTRIGLLGSVEALGDWSIGSRFEVELESNATRTVDQENRNDVGGRNFRERWIDVFITSKRFGKLSLGQGDTASKGTSEIDLSGTNVVGSADLANVAGGHFFYDKENETLSGTRVKDVFDHFDGLGRDDRIRYDTPQWSGFSLATSVVSGSGGDVALFYSDKFDQFKISAAVAYSDPGSLSETIDKTVNGSASLLYKSGLNLTLAGGFVELKEGDYDDPLFFYTKLGYRHKFFEPGETAFSLDYGRNDELDCAGDRAISFGAQFVQFIDQWATEFYLGYRNYDLDRSGADFGRIDAVLSGVRIKF